MTCVPTYLHVAVLVENREVVVQFTCSARGAGCTEDIGCLLGDEVGRELSIHHREGVELGKEGELHVLEGANVETHIMTGMQ